MEIQRRMYIVWAHGMHTHDHSSYVHTHAHAHMHHAHSCIRSSTNLYAHPHTHIHMYRDKHNNNLCWHCFGHINRQLLYASVSTLSIGNSEDVC